jgi:hypothetical protein
VGVGSVMAPGGGRGLASSPGGGGLRAFAEMAQGNAPPGGGRGGLHGCEKTSAPRGRGISSA